MRNAKEIKRAKVIANALARYAFIGDSHPSDHTEIINDARLAVSALLELQGVSNPTITDVEAVLAVV